MIEFWLMESPFLKLLECNASCGQIIIYYITYIYFFLIICCSAASSNSQTRGDPYLSIAEAQKPYKVSYNPEDLRLLPLQKYPENLFWLPEKFIAIPETPLNF